MVAAGVALVGDDILYLEQEVGGSSPPNCTKNVRQLAKITGFGGPAWLPRSYHPTRMFDRDRDDSIVRAGCW